jgi:hypothetical protein
MRSQVRDLLHGPSSSVFVIFGLLAQLVEHFPVEDVVTGSTPVQAATIYYVVDAQVAELEDAPASKPGPLGVRISPWAPEQFSAPVVELEDTLALEASAFGHAGSTPAWGTIFLSFTGV